MRAAVSPVYILSLMLGAGCSDKPPLTTGGPEPIISLVLVAGESVQVAAVMFGSHPDSAIPISSPPVPAAEVMLQVVGDDSINHVFVQSPGRPGYFETSLEVVPGATYSLRGTVTGRPVLSTTTLPQNFDVVLPVEDTILAPSNSDNHWIDYSFRSVGAVGFAVSVAGGNVVALPTILGYDGRFRLNRAFPPGQPLGVNFLAYNSAAAEWLQRPTAPRGSIDGILGTFGGAVLRRRALVWP